MAVQGLPMLHGTVASDPPFLLPLVSTGDLHTMRAPVKKTTVRKQIGQKKKKEDKCGDKEVKRAAWTMKQAEEKLREVTNARRKKPVSRMIQLAAPPDADANGEDLEKTSQEEMRTSIKVLFMGLPGEMKDHAMWDGRGGTVSKIRTMLGSQAPDARTVKSALEHACAEWVPPDDNPAPQPTRKPRRQYHRKLRDSEVLTAAKLLTDGFSRKAVTRDVNSMRVANGDGAVSERQLLRAATGRCQMKGRRRRTQKMGSTAEDSVWSRARDAQCQQFAWAMALGRQREAASNAAPAAAAAKRARQMADDLSALTRAGSRGLVDIAESAEKLAAAAAAELAAAEAQIERCTPAPAQKAFEFVVPADTARGAPITVTTGDGTVLDVTLPADARAGEKICAQYLAPVAEPTPFVLEQVLWLDEHHEKCRLGLVSTQDRVMPIDRQSGEFLPIEDGGAYPEWRNESKPKHAQEARGLFGVIMKKALVPGMHTGHKMVPFDYTGKTVLGVAAFEKMIRSEVDRVSHLKGGEWARYAAVAISAGQAEHGGKYGLRFGKEWRAEVVARLRTRGTVCITDLMDWVIDQGNALFADTEYAENWLIFHDHLSQWWEKGAQHYLAERGFKGRQLRCEGDTNKGTRYEGNLTGNSPELCPLDTHLFNDLKKGVVDHVVCTGHLPPDDERKFSMGTPKELWSAMTRTWEHTPTSERIVEDILKWPKAVTAIIAAKGCIVPELDERKGRRKSTPMVMLHPDAASANKERRDAYMAKFEDSHLLA